VDGLIQLAADEHLVRWTDWRYAPDDQDRTWDWWSIYRECRSSGGRYECYAALAKDHLQGLMVLDLEGGGTGGAGGIVVDYLAANPSNRAAQRGLNYVGVALMAVAVVRSLEEGAPGGVWLESLPGAERFYQSLGMVRQPQRSAEGNAVFALAPEVAERSLEKIRHQGILPPPDGGWARERERRLVAAARRPWRLDGRSGVPPAPGEPLRWPHAAPPSSSRSCKWLGRKVLAGKRIVLEGVAAGLRATTAKRSPAALVPHG